LKEVRAANRAIIVKVEGRGEALFLTCTRPTRSKRRSWGHAWPR